MIFACFKLKLLNQGTQIQKVFKALETVNFKYAPGRSTNGQSNGPHQV